MTRRQSSDFPRVSCLIAGCPSSTTTAETLVDARWLETNSGAGYFLCARHWRRVPRYLRRRRRWLLRHWRRINPSGCFWDYPGGSPERLRILRVERLIRLTWDRCVAVAGGEVCVAVEGVGELDAGLREELRKCGLL